MESGNFKSVKSRGEGSQLGAREVAKVGRGVRGG